ncbi:MAG: hypothetical protein A6F70_07100 [Cycloclasticus sp. symbiont of Bathymodiolus heckerae]|nr:MAG: hypothetical protein A6F70_07100 [Cycloclasticus sp. symbiont of Bathymodiolus heckerae]
MNLKQFYNIDQQQISVSREQASLFAKSVAGDFNPLHDINAKRFCVPGDLLFAVALTELGVSQSMRFDFESMVTEQSVVKLPEQLSAEFSLRDQNDKSMMTIHSSGSSSKDEKFISSLIEKYVQFSGRTFPEILIDLMQKNDVMINPARPLIIYKNMVIEIEQFAGGELLLEFSSASMEVNGKKGSVKLEFDLFVDGQKIGHGTKDMVVSGLRPFEQAAIDTIVSDYNATKKAYSA